MRAVTATSELFDAKETVSFAEELDGEARTANAVGTIVSFILTVTMLGTAPYLLQ